MSTKSFNAGPDVIQAILSGSLDISYIGPNPTVTAYIQSRRSGVRVIAGSTSGGASLVVKPAITGVEQLRGARLATPQLGNTQDIALRHWLKQQGLSRDRGRRRRRLDRAAAEPGGGQAFSTGEIDGAWVPEPFATRLVNAGGKVLVDERELWPDGRFVTTNVIARTAFVQQHPDAVRAFIEAHLDALAEIEAHPAAAQAAVIGQIRRITEQEIPPERAEGILGQPGVQRRSARGNPQGVGRARSGRRAAAGQAERRLREAVGVDALNDALAARGEPRVSA